MCIFYSLLFEFLCYIFIEKERKGKKNMNIDGLAESIGLSQEEADFYTWLKKENITNLHFGQRFNMKNVAFFIVGGTLTGNIYCQHFPAKTHISKIRFDESRPKVILP